MNETNLIIYQKWEDMAEYMLKCVVPQLPKSERYALGSHFRNTILQMGVAIARANSMRDPKYRKKEMETADRALCQLKIMIRLSYRLQYINPKKHEVSIRYLAELGKILGGWLKSYASKG
jgi:four helix bundle protein